MDTKTAKQMIGQVVQDKMGSGIAGILVSVHGEWAGIRGPFGRYDEIQVWRLEVDPT